MDASQLYRVYRVIKGGMVLLALYLAAALSLWLTNPGAFIAEDSYFYPVIARNLALTGQQTFSGIVPTNGVHPLWTYLLAGWAWTLSTIDHELLFWEGFGVLPQIVLLGLGAWNAKVAARRLGLDPLLLIVPPLVFLTAFGVLYSEALCQYFALTLLVRGASSVGRDRPWSPASFGLAAATVFLTRLDFVFCAGCALLWYGWIRGWLGRRTLTAAAAFALPAGAYVLSNLVLFGGPVPISGWLKSCFPEVCPSGLAWYPPLGLALSGYHVLVGLLPLTVSLAVSLACRQRIRGGGTVFYVLLGGAGLQMLYIMFFTSGPTMWWWYYVLPVLTVSHALALAASGWRLPAWASTAAVGLVLAIGSLHLWLDRIDADDLRMHGPSSYRTWRWAAEQGVRDTTLLISEWPGLIAFRTDNRVIAADMLTSNIRFFERMRASGNALAFIFESARAAGRPVEYVVFNGGEWLVPDPDLRAVTYRDPKRSFRELVPIGRAVLGPPIHVSEDRELIVWRVEAQPRLAQSALACRRAIVQRPPAHRAGAGDLFHDGIEALAEP